MKKEELKMLKNMKKKGIMEKLEKLKKITGNDEMENDEEDIEGEIDPEKYDQKMKEMLSNYEDNIAVEDYDKEDDEKEKKKVQVC
jgi:protein KRI1